MAFDHNGTGIVNGNIFGLPVSIEEAELILLPVPWDVTVSYHDGTANGPKAILDASPQLDFYDEDIKNAWETKVHMLPISEHWQKQSKRFRKKATKYIHWLENGSDPSKTVKMDGFLVELNQVCKQMVNQVYLRSKEIIDAGKIPALLGGDHSTPLGLLTALADKHSSFGILHIDAHMDLREAYEGFTYSHASIMYNALQIKQITKLVQVGIRDFCEAEATLATKKKSRVKVYTDRALKSAQFEGKTWKQLCDEIVKHLPEEVYISFDIDGLNPYLCPNTGTPVPGGLEFDQAMYLIKQVRKSGKKIIGFDLVEVCPGKNSDWDANVGSRVLWNLVLAALN